MMNAYGLNTISLPKRMIIPISSRNYNIPYDIRKARSIERRNEYPENLSNYPINNFHINQFQNPNLTSVNNNITNFRSNNNQYNLNNFTNSIEQNKIYGK